MKDEHLILKDNEPKQSEEDLKREENEVLTCNECGGYRFEPFYVVIWRTRLLNPDILKDGWAPVQSFRCMDCHHVNSDMDPINGLLEEV